MELPIDHFRLLGVSPSVDAGEVLRALQLRLDKAPEQGFTHETLSQRAELLRLSADLLSDSSLRKEYETALLKGAVGLEVPSRKEIAGLILLWEADASFEAFQLASKRLKPPQAPALGSSREADLILVSALACKEAAKQEKEERRYQSAGMLLKEGIQLLQRMGKLPEERKNLEDDLEQLLPYRILDLLSRDLGDQSSHQEGIRLLDDFVSQRGGLEGRRQKSLRSGLDQSEFEVFFQQIRKFLTVQEQADLFIAWHKEGSDEAGFLAVLALTASGFSRRKPERLNEARQFLKRINFKGLDSFPLLGCLDLLLADVELAKEKFRQSPDEKLCTWLDNYPGDDLAALCDYCRDWLKKDVLPGFRDVDSEEVDLESWFADRDVQNFVEQLERKGALGLAKAGFSFLSSLSSEQSTKDLLLSDDSEQLVEVDDEEIKEDLFNNINDDASAFAINRPFEYLHSSVLRFKDLLTPFKPLKSPFGLILVGTSLGFLAITIFFAPNIYQLVLRRNNSDLTQELTKEELGETKDDLENIDFKQDKESLEEKEVMKVKPLTSDRPDRAEILELLEVWLSSKSTFLSGSMSENLEIVARKHLVEALAKERSKDAALRQRQEIEANITSINIVSRKPRRIEVQAKVNYNDVRLDRSGNTLAQTSIKDLAVTYILGRDADVWRLHAFKN
ncbi:IMS domain-containing protein [Prochlorococcus sp. MIT 1300]|uniref:IMS domain-containing protein n=1 Tax=Prochlorococcus sp. MIT 1300 TaxID=3096218 RepID=UPI002A761AD8|nr:IMS domain-containing protein [Prochlorococcus sp. MIT 1300]